MREQEEWGSCRLDSMLPQGREVKKPSIKILWLNSHNNTILSVGLQVLPQLGQKQLILTYHNAGSNMRICEPERSFAGR